MPLPSLGPIIDAHAHLPLDTPASQAWLDAQNLSVVNICVATDELGGLAAQRQWYRTLHSQRPDRFAWITSFEPTDPPDKMIAQLADDFAAGACGCKVWKNLGMALRDAEGGFVFVDDDRFAPIFKWLEQQGRPLLMHIAEPIDAWLPLNPSSPHHGYYSRATHWHWAGRTDVPSHERLIASRDAILERYPRLPAVGCHFGSQEHDLVAVAERLVRYPNYHVDTGARLCNMVRHSREEMARFLTTHASRAIWGIDWVWTRPLSEMADQWPERKAAMEARLDLELRFLATADDLTYQGRHVQGLTLSSEVVAPLIRGNAAALYFGKS